MSDDEKISGSPSEPANRNRWKRTGIYGGLALLLGFIVGQLTHLPVASIEWVGSLAGTFIISPGFGGLAALTVGIFGFHSVRQEFRQTKQRDETAALLASQAAARDTEAVKRVSESDWWKRVEWITQTAQKTAHGAGLPATIAAGTLTQLRKEAAGDVQTQACDLLFDYFNGISKVKTDTNEEAKLPTTSTAQEPEDTPLERLFRETLANYKRSAGDTFKKSVMETLCTAGLQPAPDNMPSPPGNLFPRVDGDFLYRGQHIFVETKWVTPGKGRSNIDQDLSYASKLLKADPKAKVLLVYSDDTGAGDEVSTSDPRIRTIHWQPTEGQKPLASILQNWD